MSQPAVAKSVEEIQPGLFRWNAFSPEHKVELTSHAVLEKGRLFYFDPFPLVEKAFQELARKGAPTAIILTNENHERDTLVWRERLKIPVWAAAEASLEMNEVRRFAPDQTEWETFVLHSLAGGAGGEMAFRVRSRSLVVFGDAVVNLPSRQLELLPEKYCRDAGALRGNLKKLLREPFEQMVMAHGEPIRQGAFEKLGQLV
jgi:hypothetical protein